MNIKNIRNIGTLALLLGTTIISGCSSLGSSGTSEYGCTGLPQGVQCMSAREVYNLTEEAGPVRADPKSLSEDGGAADRHAKDTLLKRMAESNGVGINQDVRVSQGHQLSTSPISSEPTPIRSRSQIMRIWVSPWESTDGDLNVSGMIFTEIEPRRWNIGVQEDIDAPSITPLQARIEKIQDTE